MKKPILTIIVPCYNEEEVLEETIHRLNAVLRNACRKGLASSESTVLYVDDGSSDATWTLIDDNVLLHPTVTGLKLSRNFGHQNALLAGMETARRYSDCVVTIDADLQDDEKVIEKFLIKYNEGFDIVYGVRDGRTSDTFFKRRTALAFYQLMELLGVSMIPNHADFRLLSRRALAALSNYKEKNIFLRGIVPLLGFREAKVYYDRSERQAGISKYPLHKMLSFAFDGITSFSLAPIRLLTLFGAAILVVGVAAGIYALVQYFLGNAVLGWTSIILSIWVLGGIQLMAIGLIGEYIGKIFKETKGRPRYVIEEKSLHASRLSSTHL